MIQNKYFLTLLINNNSFETIFNIFFRKKKKKRIYEFFGNFCLLKFLKFNENFFTTHIFLLCI